MASPAFCGRNTVEIWDRGARNKVGDIYSATRIQWGRIRDDISKCQVDVPLETCCGLLEQIEPVQNELHVLRDGVTVWVGVITRMEFEWDQVQIFCEDMLWVAKRRALPFSYNHQEPCEQCEPGPLYGTGSISAIENARILLEDWCYGDADDGWGMSEHLFPIVGPDDPKSNRQANAFSNSIWGEFDKLAEDYGIDYCTVGRDIYWFDINLQWLIIEPLVPEDIAQYPRVVEYGNDLATRYFRTDGSGYAGIAEADPAFQAKYGSKIDIISSESTQAASAPPRMVVDENGNVVPGSPVLPDPPSAAKLATWTATAEQRLYDRVPVKRNILVPANSTLMPTSPWDINTLTPGCWMEATVDRLCRPTVTDWQRLHEMKVTETGTGGEIVQVSLISAPSTFVAP